MIVFDLFTVLWLEQVFSTTIYMSSHACVLVVRSCYHHQKLLLQPSLWRLIMIEFNSPQFALINHVC
jgi:hypothetical protein